jgi:hypothetical protein
MPPKRATAVSNLGRWSGDVSTSTTQVHLAICVPARGYREVRVTAPEVSAIPPSLRSADLWNTPGRRGGVLLSEIALADEVGAPCTP